jgi:hypothetical protein
MGMALFIGLGRSRFSCFCPDFERQCWGGRSRTSSVPIICWSAVCLETSLCPPLVASSAASVGDLAIMESLVSEEPMLEAQEAPVLATPGADEMPQGTTCVEVDGVGP